LKVNSKDTNFDGAKGQSLYKLTQGKKKVKYSEKKRKQRSFGARGRETEGRGTEGLKTTQS